MILFYIDLNVFCLAFPNLPTNLEFRAIFTPTNWYLQNFNVNVGWGEKSYLPQIKIWIIPYSLF